MRERTTRARGRERKVTRAEVENRASLARRQDRPVLTREPASTARTGRRDDTEGRPPRGRGTRPTRPRPPPTAAGGASPRDGDEPNAREVDTDAATTGTVEVTRRRARPRSPRGGRSRVARRSDRH